MNVMRFGWALVHFLWQGALIAVVYTAVRRFGVPSMFDSSGVKVPLTT
jgi:hypothetical protein